MAQVLSRQEYQRWVEQQPRGRYERVGGVVHAMAPERWVYARIKANVWQALRHAILSTGLTCQAAPDGMTVEIDDDTDYEPDALVNCGAPIPDDAIAAPNPVVVVEVLSPSTRSVDNGGKLADYFRVPSIQHYLLVRTQRQEVIHHRRTGDRIETRIIGEGDIHLDPPGIRIALGDLYAD